MNNEDVIISTIFQTHCTYTHDLTKTGDSQYFICLIPGDPTWEHVILAQIDKNRRN